MPSSQYRKLRRAVARLIRAELADSWKYGGNPDDVPAIESELKTARVLYNRACLPFRVALTPASGLTQCDMHDDESR